MKEHEIAAAVVNAAYKLHTGMGPGILETVYEVTLAHELRKDGIRFDEGFRADLIHSLQPVHSRQVLTYLRLTNKRLGLLINFGEADNKNGIKRIVNGLPEEPAAF